MSIHPIPEARHFDPILRDDLAELYTTRAARLRALAEGHELSAYLAFCADIADAQKAALCAGFPALTDPREIASGGAWLAGLDRMIARLQTLAQAEVAHTLQRLTDLPAAVRTEAGIALAEGRFEEVDPALAPFLWAGLSLAVAQGARAAGLPPKGAEETTWCPVCGSHPVASHIHTGDRQGLRYLHCAMCECEWHMVRAKCSCCGNAGELDYLSFDTPEAVIRAEACNACGGYLKVISAERDPDIETVADDLATLVLDDAAVSEGFGRTGFNPFALPG